MRISDVMEDVLGIKNLNIRMTRTEALKLMARYYGKRYIDKIENEQ